MGSTEKVEKSDGFYFCCLPLFLGVEISFSAPDRCTLIFYHLELFGSKQGR